MFKLICKTFCSYYKEGKEDVGYCFPVVLFCAKDLNYAQLREKVVKIDRSLTEIFCLRCEFFPLDCDFHLLPEPGNPCGGYLYFLNLIKKRTLSIGELKRLCEAFSPCVSKNT